LRFSKEGVMVRRSIWVGLAVLCLVCGLKTSTTFAQAVYGSILGTVTDPQGGAVSGAKVTVTSLTKSTTEETTTNESGNYSVTHLIPDTYKIRIEGPGFKATDIPSVQVSADSAAHVDATMQVGAVTQSVEVTGEIPQLTTDRADVDVEFSQKYVEDLPVLNQHFSGTNFELDGTDNQDPILGIIVVNPNLDAVGEAKIALQDYDAESGKATAGIVRVQTKSGSNEFHGSGFYYYRNSDQQARDPFTNKPGKALAPANWKQFGGSVGGPILKNKLFFFGDYQGTKQQQGITNQYTIPTATVLSTCGFGKPGNCDLSEYLAASGAVNGQIYQPGTFVASAAPTSPCFDTAQNRASALLTGNCRAPFAGNLVPNTLISPQATAILALFPAPTAGGVTNNLVTTGTGPFDQKSFDTRIDYSAPRNYQIFGRFSLDYFSLSGKGGLGALGGLGFGPGGLNGSSNVHNYSLATGFTKPIGPTWLTDFRFGWFKYNPQTAYSDASASPMDGFGVPGLNSGPGVVGPPTTGGLAGIDFGGTGGFTPFGDGLNIGRCNCPLTESEQQVQFVSNWTNTRGNHTFKFGADIRYALNLRVPSDASRTGLLHINSGDTANAGVGGLSFATFLLGDVTSFERFVSSSLTAAERQKRWFFYGQDSWRVSPKFTMTYGLRWEIYFPESVNGKNNGGFANIEQGVIRVAGNGPIGLNGNVDNTLKAFAPRLSFAYQFDPKTVLRIGYGRGFDIGVFGSNFGHVVTQNLPVLANQTLTDTNCTQQPTCGSGDTNDRSAVFTLSQGPLPFTFANILGQIDSNGTLPLRGPQGNVSPRIRPTVQRLPTIDQWNATIQRQITPTLNITASYVGNKGTHVFAGNGPAYNTNEAAIGPGTDAYSCLAPGAAGNSSATQFKCTASFKPFISQAFRRRLFLNGVPTFTYPNFPGVTCCSDSPGDYFGNDADNKYNALQVKVEKRVSNGLQFMAHYTYSKAYFYDGGYFSVDKKFAWGPDDYNRNHVFVINTVYELPIGRGKKFMSDAGRVKDLVIGGWQVTNTLNYSGGLPFTPSLGECGQVSDAGPCRPIATGKLKTGTSRDSAGNLLWFTPLPKAALSQSPDVFSNTDLTGLDTCTLARPTSGPFALPACGQIGNVGRNSYRGPRGFYSDMALSKTFSITERYKAQFRFDAYNVFNHPVLGFNGSQGNTCVDCGSDSGRITSTENNNSPGSPSGMRQLQFGVRFTF